MKRLPLLASAALTVGTVVGTSATVYANNYHNPAGNNGFVKVNRDELADGIPQNEPHVSCTFNLEFYNYDKNNNRADVTFALQAPTNKAGDSLKVTSGNLHPFIGADAAGGSSDLDAREAYTLDFTGTPQPNQGYHVKLTVNAPGSKGADVKHKVFWVEPCAPAVTPAPSPSPTPNPSPTPAPATNGGTTTTTPQVLGANTTATQTATELPNTGMNATAMLALSGVIGVATAVAFYWRQKLLSFVR